MKKLIVTLFLLQVSIFSFSQLVIQMKRQGGVSIVPCKVNGLSLSFIFDTGASDVTISLTEASFMLKNGYLKKEDITGSQKYLDATGNISEGITINLREIEIEGLKLYNVKASIVKSMEAPLLLGQSALSKLGTVYLDLDKNQITILSASKSLNTDVKKNNDFIANLDTYKKGFLLLAKSMTEPICDTNLISKYFTLNNSAKIPNDSLWAIPSDAYKALNATSYYYTFWNTKKSNSNLNSNDNSSLIDAFRKLKSFSLEKGIDWAMLDTTNIVIKPFGDKEIVYSFNCGSFQYCFVTTIRGTFTNPTQIATVYIPHRIDTRSFFEFRNSIFHYYLSYLDEIRKSRDQNLSLSYFYGDLLNRFEKDYNNLSVRDKRNFSDLQFEPTFWCDRAASLNGLGILDPENDPNLLVNRIRYFTQGIQLYQKFTYWYTDKEFFWTKLYTERGECRYKLEDYAGAYEDYKKAINIYETNRDAKKAMKYSIAGDYYDFAKICLELKRYSECKSSIERGINTYFDGIERYEPAWVLLHTLRGNLNYFIFKNKQQACKDWSKAGELGDNNAFDYIKKYCNN